MLKKILLIVLAVYVLQSVATINVYKQQQQEILRMESYTAEVEHRLLSTEERLATALAELNPPRISLRYDSIEMTPRDKALMALCIYHECRGESFDGQRAVAEVILNRVLSPKWPNTIEEVIYDEGQFAVSSYLLSGDIRDPECLTTAYEVIDYVMTHCDYVFGSDMGYFSSTPYTKCSFVKLGNHYFARM